MISPNYAELDVVLLIILESNEEERRKVTHSPTFHILPSENTEVAGCESLGN